MTLEEAIISRHSVRAYKKERIEANIVAKLEEETAKCNEESGLHLQLVTEDEDAFDCMMAHYGKFRNVANYFVVSGRKDDPQLERKCGYYGERLVLLAQQLGLNTCWVALTFKKNERMRLADNEKLVCVIAVGYGQDAGKTHRIKTYNDVCSLKEVSETFKKGVEYALLAPTSLNQQRFKITMKDGKGFVEPKWGFYTKIDAGIAQYHFDLAFL